MIASFLSAISFLTRLPVPAWIHSDPAALRSAPVWFPAVGLLLGSIYVVIAFLTIGHLPSTVVAALILITDALLTGALHLDGLADMTDGFGGGRTTDDVLRIMRDHAIGSYGGVALVILMLLKFACLSELLKNTSGFAVLLAAPAFSRWSVLWLSRLAPYARPDGSGAVPRSVTRMHLAVATTYCAIVACLHPLQLFAAWLMVTAITLVTMRVSKRRIGGITGDVLGANVVVAEGVQFVIALIIS